MSMITYEEWKEKYKPILDEDGGSRFFETYGDDFEFVKSQKQGHIWTEVSCDYVTEVYAGYHSVNRMGYYITEIAWEDKNIFFKNSTDDCALCQKEFGINEEHYSLPWDSPVCKECFEKEGGEKAIEEHEALVMEIVREEEERLHGKKTD